MIIQARIIRIGNSRGIRIPRVALEQSQLGDKVELEVQPGQIIIRARQDPRQGWAEAFQMMAEHGDDQLLVTDHPPLTTWDEEEWEW